MYLREFTDNNNKTWKRIDKRQARNLYNKGVTLVLCPDNLRPFTMWHCEIEISNKTSLDNDCKPYDFDKIVNGFEIYNCIDRETGYHTAFYREVE